MKLRQKSNLAVNQATSQSEPREASTYTPPAFLPSLTWIRNVLTSLCGWLAHAAFSVATLIAASAAADIPSAACGRLSPPETPTTIIHVDDSASGAMQDGRFWHTAYRTLGSALTRAEPGTEIRVAAGTYQPGSNRGDSFQLKNGVSIRGGYAGFGAADPDNWDPRAHVTLFTGDLCNNDDDEPAECDGPSDCRRPECNDIHSVNCLPDRTCDWRADNSCHVFDANSSIHGAPSGLFATYCSLSTTNSRIDAVVDFRWGRCGPFGSCADSLNSFLNDFTVLWVGLVSPPHSGAWTFHVRSDDGVRLWINDVLQIDNWVAQPATTYTSEPLWLDAGKKHRLRMEYFELTGSASIQLRWSGPFTPEQVIPLESFSQPAHLSGVTISGGNANGERGADGCHGQADGGGMSITGNPILVNCVFAHNSAKANGGAISIGSAATPIVRNCLFENNTAAGNGGAIAMDGTSFSSLEGCAFSNNRALGPGGAIRQFDNTAVQLVNCLLWNNVGMTGGAVFADGTRSRTELVNCTVVANRARDLGLGGGLRKDGLEASEAEVLNSILWNNVSGDSVSWMQQVSGNALVLFSCVEDLYPAGGSKDMSHNISTYPDFQNLADGDGADEELGTHDDGLQLTRDSSCIDVGSEGLIRSDVAIDILDNPRIAGFGVDMGAFEWQACTEPPQTGHSVQVRWNDRAGVWGEFPSWCPQQVPNNGIVGGIVTTFDVMVDLPDEGQEALVTLNISPTIDRLLIGTGDTIQLGAESSVVQTLAVLPPGGAADCVPGDDRFVNRGVIRAQNGKRLVLDACEIAQEGLGTLAADGERSVLQITAARILGGFARTSDEGKIHLVAGAELVGVNVQGIVVPDGQVASFSKRITNDNILAVAPEGIASAFFGPVPDEKMLDENAFVGKGRVRLGGADTAFLGDFFSSFTNDTDHTIDGAGVVFGEVFNDGIIEANDCDEDDPGCSSPRTLVLSPPGVKVNGPDSKLRATGGATLDIQTDVLGDGRLEISGGNVIVRDAETSFASAVLESTIESGASLNLQGTATLNVTGLLKSFPEKGSGTPPIIHCSGRARVGVQGDFELLDAVGLSYTSSLPFVLGGNFINRIHMQPELFDFSRGTLVLNGQPDSPPVQSFEVAGRDLGDTSSGYRPGNFAMGTVAIAAENSVEFRNNFANTVGTGDCAEALYVQTFRLGANSIVSTANCRVYYETLDNQGGTIIQPGPGTCGGFIGLGCADMTPGLVETVIVDARQPSEIDGTNSRGLATASLTVHGDKACLKLADFSLQTFPESESRLVNLVVNEHTATLSIDPPLPPLSWGEIGHAPSDGTICVGYLPGDVSGDHKVGELDVLEMVSCLSSSVLCAAHECDIDRSGSCNPSDLLREIDLINGAGAYEPWLGLSLSPSSCKN